MDLINLLATPIDTFSGFGMPYSLNWIGKIIQWLIGIGGSIGVGIILFTIALKLITLPLDIISRASMKKNNLKMKAMRPQLEKLQRQYANNKEMYNRKIQALYKKEGFSMFSSCLPTIVTIIIFFVVMTQFSTYSNYTNLKMMNDMSLAYTQSIENYNEKTGTNYIYFEKNEDGSLKKNFDEKNKNYYSLCAYLNENEVFEKDASFDNLRKAVVKEKTSEYEATYKISDINAFAQIVKGYNEGGWNSKEAVKVGETEDCQIIKDGENYKFNPAMFAPGTTEEVMSSTVANKVMEYAYSDFVEKNVKLDARKASKLSYEKDAPKFLWIQNLWMADLPFKHPVNQNITDYEFSRKLGNRADNDQFKEITALLDDEKKAPNGFFILVVLSIGLMLLSQFISMRAQKDQMELQTVDGQGAQSSKMMMWIMPIMFGVFSFFYSASFSLYMVVSTVLSTISTLTINYFVELSFKKKYADK